MEERIGYSFLKSNIYFPKINNFKCFKFCSPFKKEVIILPFQLSY